MDEPITLNVRDVALAAKKAYEEKRLSAQTTRSLRACFYRDRKDSPCAIGAALPEEAARAFDARYAAGDGSDIGSIVDEDLIVTDDRQGLVRLQTAHDNWATARGRENRTRYRKEFLSVLNSFLADS